MTKQPDLAALRRTLIMAMWLDYKLFGYVTESAWAIQKRIVREKSGKVIQFPNGQKAKKAA